MTIKDYLLDCENKYLKKILEEHSHTLIEELYQGMGALKKYKFENILLMIVNDKGIVDIEISTINEKEENFFDVAAYAQSNGIDYRYDKKGIMCLNLQQQKEVLENNWDKIEEDMSKQNYIKSMEAINKVRKERSKIMFPKMGIE